MFIYYSLKFAMYLCQGELSCININTVHIDFMETFIVHCHIIKQIAIIIIYDQSRFAFKFILEIKCIRVDATHH